VSYAGAKHNRERMSDETIVALNNHIQDLVVQRKAHSILLDWFGGEPMMYFDDVINNINLIADIIPNVYITLRINLYHRNG
jgi:uncharacterized protein